MDSYASSNDSLLSPQPSSPWILVPVICLITSTITTNLAIIGAFLFVAQVRTVFNYYLFNLAISDCLTGAISMTSFAILTYHRHWPLAEWQCTAWIYFDFLGTSQSLQTIMIIACDRFWAITWPISYRQRHSEKKCVILICSSWIWSNLVILPGLLCYRAIVNVYHGDCFWSITTQPHYASSVYVAVLTQWLPSAVTVCCYSLTSWKLWIKHRRGMIRVENVEVRDIRPEREVVRMKKQKQAFWLLSALLAALVIQFGPWFVYQMLELAIGYENEEIYLVTYWLGYSLSAVNPFLFNLGSVEMHNGLKLLGQKVIGCK